MSLPTIACGPLPEVVDLKVSGKIINGQQVYSAVQESVLWPNNSKITVSFFEATGLQKAIVKGAFSEYTAYANVNFVYVDDNSVEANIRIAFASSGAWSAIGKQALKLEGQPTMDLGSITETNSPEVNRAIALHEVGHALGREHEWDGKNVQLADAGKDEAIAQHAHLYAGKCVSNFPQIDDKSVMSYFLPSEATKDGKGIAVNSDLAATDKAWLAVNYPGRSAVSNGIKWNLLHALDTLNVPAAVASQILLSKQVAGQRAHYENLISTTWGKQIPIGTETKSKISNQLGSLDTGMPHTASIDLKSKEIENEVPALTTDDVDASNVLAAVIMHPDFQQTVTNLAEHDLVNHGVNLADYPIQVSADVQQGLLGTLGPLLGQLAGSMFDVQNGIQTANIIDPGMYGGTRTPGLVYYPGKPLPPDVQQGIFDVFTKVLKNPAFTNVVTEIAKGVLGGVGA